MTLQPSLGPGHFFQFLNPIYTVSRTPWMVDQTAARPLPTQDNTYIYVGVERWRVYKPLSVNVFVTLATQYHLEYNCKALFEAHCIFLSPLCHLSDPRSHSIRNIRTQSVFPLYIHTHACLLLSRFGQIRALAGLGNGTIFNIHHFLQIKH
jgi:hypothetical protein